MSAYTAKASPLPAGVNGANHFVVRVICPAMTGSDTLDITLPDGAPKDALPLGAAIVYSLSTDTYTRDDDLSVVLTHIRTTGVTRVDPSGNVAAGSILLLRYAGYG